MAKDSVSHPDPALDRMRAVSSIPFWGVHLAAVVGIIWLGWSWAGLGLALASYFIRMFGITAGYHRYFSHRTYRTGRVMQFLLALLGTLSVQKGVLWWAAHHRWHHKYSDEPQDVHSVKQDGFYWSHMGWILSSRWEETDYERVKDFEKYPELRWLNEHYLFAPVAMAVIMFALGGAWALVWGFFVSTTLLWHGTFTINSLAHLMGRRRYATTDNSKNSALLALITLGEGWHNNHHYYQRATNQGFYWWEFDISFYVLKMMSWVGLVWDLHVPPAHVRDKREPALEAAPAAPHNQGHESVVPASGVVRDVPGAVRSQRVPGAQPQSDGAV